MDDADRRLIAALIADGRASYTALSAEVGLSPDTVRDRVRRLERDHVVKVMAVFDPALLGFRSFALVGLRLAGPAADVAQELTEAPELDFVVRTLGSYDILAEFVCHDDRELVDSIDALVKTVPGVLAVEAFPYLRIIKWTPPASRAFSLRDESLVATQLDDLDRRLAELLQMDGRANYRDLAHAAGVNYSTVRRRAQQLISSGVVHITTEVNRLITGEELPASILMRRNGTERDFETWVRDCPEVRVAVQTAGSADILLDVACRDREHLARLLHELHRFSGGSMDVALHAEILKLPASWTLHASRRS